jgi:hypothetical protein
MPLDGKNRLVMVGGVDNQIALERLPVFDSGSGNVKTSTSASTSGSSSVEPFAVESVLTGAGGVGGRCRFQLDTNVVLGGWANALKAHTKFGASGRVTGLGSALCVEMDLSAGTSAGNYAPLEIELNLGETAVTGTATALIYASVNGHATGKGRFDDHGYLFNLQGVTAGSGHVFQAAAVSAIDSTHALKVKIGATDYFIPLHTSAAFA